MYNWIETTFNVSGGVTQAIAVILALAVVLLLFSLFIFVLKRLMGANAPQSRNRQPRIAIMDSATVDARRRLLLIRRDNIEHLILVGGPSDVVVEQNIVRNTPLTQPRTGQHAPSPSNMPMPVKAALAPGPEIPARPDDLLEDQEATPPTPAAQARPPVQHPAPAAPAYQAPVPPSAPAPSAPSQTAAAPQRSYPDPVASRPMTARAPEAAPAPVHSPAPAAATPSPVQQVASPRVGEDKPEAGSGVNRASDLLRAATQNGFNRTVSRSSAPVTPAQDAQAVKNAVESKTAVAGSGDAEVQASDAATAPTRAPEVRPVVSTAAVPQESKATSTLKTLARPFTARDRPSYGGTITPPASGPAARAKTALLKPVEQVLPEHKVEPVLTATTTVIATAVAAPQLTEPEVTPAEDTGPKPEEAATSTQQSQEAEDETASNAATPGDASDVLETEAAEAGTATTPDDADQTKASAEDDGASTPSQPAEEAAPSREISLDIGDLLEDVPEPAVSAEVKPDVPVAPPPQAEEASVELPEEPKQEAATATAAVTSPTPTFAPATAPVSASPVTSPAPPVKAEARPSAGLGDRNPIEEEMAKILDELGGQSNG